MENEEPQLSGMEKLKQLPMIDRIIVMLDMLQGLQKTNMEKSGRPELTKQIEIDNAAYRAKSKAYIDTSMFLAKFFEVELSDKLLPPKEEVSIIQEV
jgi:hypothetical protein